MTYHEHGDSIESYKSSVENRPKNQEWCIDEYTELADVGQSNNKGAEEGVEYEHEYHP